jgi:hypothetical protein
MRMCLRWILQLRRVPGMRDRRGSELLPECLQLGAACLILLSGRGFDKVAERYGGAGSVEAVQRPENTERNGTDSCRYSEGRDPLSGLLDPLDGELARHAIRGEETSAKPSQLKTCQQCLPVTAQRRPDGQRGQRSESKNGRRESETGRLSYHSPNLGTDLAPGYIPTHGRSGPEPPKIDTLGRR